MSAETVEKTTLGEVASGGPVNLERALRLADRLGGHLVSGHVDGIAKVTELVTVGEAWRVTFSAPRELLPYIAEKGSVALDGVSLTVNAVRDPHFEVMLIPHTWQVTTLHQLAVGRPVNLEVDLLARYVVRYVTAGGPGAGSPTTPGANFEAALRRAGYK